MAEKRGRDRVRKRIKLHYGEEGKMRTAFTEDFSPSGLFIKAAIVHAPNSIIEIELCLDNGETIAFEARVMWAKRVPPNLMRLSRKSGMGVRIRCFHRGGDLYKALCREFVERHGVSGVR